MYHILFIHLSINGHLGRVQLFVTPWTVAHQAPPSMGFSSHEYWSGFPFPSPGDLPNPAIEPGSPRGRQMLYHPSYQGSPIFYCVYVPYIIYPFISQWTFKLLPYLGYYKQYCNEYRNTYILWTTFSSGYMPKNLDHMVAIFRFWRHLRTILHSSCSNLHPYPQCRRIPLSPHLLQNLWFADFLMIAILTDVKCFIIIVLICISLNLVMLSIFSYVYWPSVGLLWINVFLGILLIFWFGCLLSFDWVSWAVSIFL